MKKLRIILLVAALVISYGCGDKSMQIEPEIIDTHKIQLLASQFNTVIAKSTSLELCKTHFTEIPDSKIMNNLLLYLDSNERKIANTVLNHSFFNSVFYGRISENNRSQELLTLLSESSNMLTNELISNIEIASNNFVSTNDVQIDKVSFSNTLIGIVNTFKTSVVNEIGLDFIEANVLLVNAAIQIETIPTLVDLAITIGNETGEGINGRIASWSKFWKIVAVVVVTAIAAAVIGGAIVGLIAYVNQVAIGATVATASAAAAAAAAIGAFVGLGVGTVVGAIQGSQGSCPADGWFDTSVPLVDWQDNCF